MKSRKEADRRYYLRKVKPFRKKKDPTGYHLFLCPVCSKRSFMRNLLYKPLFSVGMLIYKGRAGIVWLKDEFDIEQKATIKKLLKERIIQVVKDLEITAEELGFDRVEMPIRVAMPIRTGMPGRMEMPIRTAMAIRTRMPIRT